MANSKFYEHMCVYHISTLLCKLASILPNVWQYETVLQHGVSAKFGPGFVEVGDAL